MDQKNEILWKIFREQDTTQVHFAKLVGMDRPTNIGKWLSNQQEISFRKLNHIANCFGYKLKVTLEKK
jgi:transcriptional regulator with XRE-family HTH domain